MNITPTVLKTPAEHAEEYKKLCKEVMADKKSFWKSLDLLVIHKSAMNITNSEVDTRKHACALLLQQIRLKRVVATEQQIILLIQEVSNDNLQTIAKVGEFIQNVRNIEKS